MSTSPAAVGSRPGLATVVDVVVAPKQAFERLRIVPTWGWAFLVAMVVGMIGYVLTTPAVLHALDVSGPALYAAQPSIASLPASEQHTAIARSLAFLRVVTQLQFLFVPIVMLLAALIAAVVMLIANAVSRGDATFKKLWALAINVQVVTVGIGLLLGGLICVVRGPAGFSTISDVQHVLPSLALLAPSGGPKLVAFLSTINVVQIWGTVLLALGMTVVGRIGPAVAWTTSILLLLIGGAFGAAFAR